MITYFVKPLSNNDLARADLLLRKNRSRELEKSCLWLANLLSVVTEDVKLMTETYGEYAELESETSLALTEGLLAAMVEENYCCKIKI